MKVWDTMTGREALTLRPGGEILTAVTFGPDGWHLATAANSLAPDIPCELKVWDATPLAAP